KQLGPAHFRAAKSVRLEQLAFGLVESLELQQCPSKLETWARRIRQQFDGGDQMLHGFLELLPAVEQQSKLVFDVTPCVASECLIVEHHPQVLFGLVETVNGHQGISQRCANLVKSRVLSPNEFQILDGFPVLALSSSDHGEIQTRVVNAWRNLDCPEQRLGCLVQPVELHE